jgi:catechol 2,3-dioxygenase-like lactoylglutathione lyase family enzyme
MNILKLEHAALLVQDVERSRRFYCEVLGLQEIPSGGNCFLRKGDAEVHLLAAPQGRVVELGYRADDLADGYITHVAFEVDDLEEAQQHLKNSNIPIVCGPRPRFDGKEQLYFCDPDGYAIELFAQKK